MLLNVFFRAICFVDSSSKLKWLTVKAGDYSGTMDSLVVLSNVFHFKCSSLWSGLPIQTFAVRYNQH